MAYDVLTSGYVSMDHMVKIDRPARVGFTSLIGNQTCTQIYYGGCAVNIAYALSRLGAKALPVQRVGRDWEQNGFRAFLTNGGVSLEATTLVEQDITSTSYMVQDNEGQHITLFYPGAMDERYHHKLDGSLFEGARYGVVTVASRSDNEEFFRQCRAHGVPVVFGMKCDSDAFPGPFLSELLRHSEIVFMNESERDCIIADFGLGSITDLLERGEARTIVVTYGSRGSEFWHKEDSGEVNSACVETCRCLNVVDTTGGGDAYMSGFLFGLLEGRPLGHCCQMGATLSSFVLEHEGCCTGVPTREQLMERFESFTNC